MSKLFSPIEIGPFSVRNRLWMSPMCQYSAEPSGPELGRPNDWHFTHYQSRGYGGVGAVIVESTAVSPEGRLSPFDLSLHDDAQLESFTRLASMIKETGATPGIQLGHGGRKSSGARPWEGSELLYPPSSEIGWEPVAPSAIEFSDSYYLPRALTGDEVEELIEKFVAAAQRAVAAGFELIELHGAHGYLIHQFLSPRTNHRTDKWGEDRAAFPLEIIRRVRPIAPALGIRISATEWAENEEEPSWTLADTVEFIERAQAEGIDFVDVSTGGNLPDVEVPSGDEYQVPFAERVHEVGVPTSTVGRIVDPLSAEELIGAKTDVVSIGRQLLSDPYLPQLWRRRLGEKLELPIQYHRAWWR